MPLNKYDMVLVDYTVKVKESGEVVETTSADKAKEFKIYDPSRYYEPLLVIIGEGRVIKGFEEALEKADVGNEVEVEIPPEKAYGLRDPSKVKVIPLKVFLKSGVRAEVGKVVEVNGELGTVRSVSSGRVVVDFNHPLADKTLIYRFKVVKKLEDDIEKVKYLIKRHIRDIALDDINVSIEGEPRRVVVELPRKVLLSEGIQYAKRLASDDILKYLNANEVVFIERYSREGTSK